MNLNAKHIYSQKNSRGFTLIEVLIAITVTALLGMGVWQVLNGTIRTNNVLSRQQEILDALQRTFLFIERDIQQIVSRPIRNEFGDPEYTLSNRNTLYKIEFTRSGWRNPLGDKRSELQRVAYELQDSTLVRNYWTVLDRAQDSEPKSVPLNEQITSFDVTFLTDKNQWTDDWPSDQHISSTDGDIAQYLSLPKAVKISLEHELYGKLYRIFSPAESLDLSVPKTAEDSGNGNNTGEGIK